MLSATESSLQANILQMLATFHIIRTWACRTMPRYNALSHVLLLVCKGPSETVECQMHLPLVNIATIKIEHFGSSLANFWKSASLWITQSPSLLRGNDLALLLKEAEPWSHRCSKELLEIVSTFEHRMEHPSVGCSLVEHPSLLFFFKMIL